MDDGLACEVEGRSFDEALGNGRFFYRASDPHDSQSLGFYVPYLAGFRKNEIVPNGPIWIGGACLGSDAIAGPGVGAVGNVELSPSAVPSKDVSPSVQSRKIRVTRLLSLGDLFRLPMFGGDIVIGASRPLEAFLGDGGAHLDIVL